MRGPTAEEKKAFYWHSNKKWYRINEKKDCFELTDKAPKRAKESFELYCKLNAKVEN